MAKLIGLLAATAVAAVVGSVFFWRKNRKAKASRWSAAKSSAVSLTKTAAQGAGKAAEKVAGHN